MRTLVLWVSLVLFLQPVRTSAGTVTLGGDLTGKGTYQGDVTPISPGYSEKIPFFANGAANNMNHFITGNVIATDTVTGVTLTLTNLKYRDNTGGPNGVTETIHIVEQYDVVTGNWFTTHSLDGSSMFNLAGQSTSVSKTSTHNAVVLTPLFAPAAPAAGKAFPQVVPFTAGPTALTNVPTGATYTIGTTFIINLIGGAAANNGTPGWVELDMPSSGEDISSVPEPSSLVMLTGSLLLMGRLSILRARKSETRLKPGV
jgi:hypothetical protein